MLWYVMMVCGVAHGTVCGIEYGNICGPVCVMVFEMVYCMVMVWYGVRYVV